MGTGPTREFYGSCGDKGDKLVIKFLRDKEAVEARNLYVLGLFLVCSMFPFLGLAIAQWKTVIQGREIQALLEAHNSHILGLLMGWSMLPVLGLGIAQWKTGLKCCDLAICFFLMCFLFIPGIIYSLVKICHLKPKAY